MVNPAGADPARPSAGAPASRSDASTGPDSVPPSVIGTSARLVGRDEELRVVVESVQRFEGGAGRTLVLVGEAGIGKTRLLGASTQAARLRGIRALAATCHEQDRSLPYGPWVELLRGFVASESKAVVHRLLGPHLPALVRLLPDLADRVWLYDPATKTPREWERGQFVDSVARFFVGLTAEAPLLLAIDDIGWADAASLDLLQHIATVGRDRPLGVVAAVRDTHLDENPPAAELLRELDRRRLLTPISLRRLSADEVGALVAELLEEPSVSRAFRRLVFEKSQGNPYFVEEILRALAQEEAIRWTAEGWERGSLADLQIPSTIRGAINQRLERLGAETARLLRTAALLGDGFSFELLVKVGDVGEEASLRAIESGLDARLLVERRPGTGPATYGFGHPLVQEVLARGLSEARARRAHLRAAQAILELETDRIPELSGELARHFLRAGDLARALRYELEAGRHAAQLFATREAVRHYEAALSLAERIPSGSFLAPIQENLAEQLALKGELDRARELFETAAARYLAAGDRTRAGGCLCKAFERCGMDEIPTSTARRLIDRAGELLQGSADLEALLSLHAARSRIIDFSGQSGKALPDAQEALGLAERLGSPAALVRGLISVAEILPVDRHREVFELIERAAEVARTNQLIEGRADVEIEHAKLLMHCRGDLAAPIAAARVALDWARRAGNVEREIFTVPYCIAWMQFRAGELEEAERWFRGEPDLRSEHGRPPPAADQSTVWGAVLIERGRLAQAEPILRSVEADLARRAEWSTEVLVRTHLARLALRTGRLTEALDQIERAERKARQSGPAALYAMHFAEALATSVRAHLSNGDAESARARSTELDDLARRLDGDHLRAWGWRARGEILAFERNYLEAVESLRRAAGMWENLGWKYEFACSLAELAEVYSLLGRGAEGRTTSARARGVFDVCGVEVEPPGLPSPPSGAGRPPAAP